MTRLGRAIACSSRRDIQIFGVPLARMCNEHFTNARTRILMKNMAYVGTLAALLELDRKLIEELVQETFARKAALTAGEHGSHRPRLRLRDRATSTVRCRRV